jgi:hypothetical protein
MLSQRHNRGRVPSTTGDCEKVANDITDRRGEGKRALEVAFGESGFWEKTGPSKRYQKRGLGRLQRDQQGGGWIRAGTRRVQGTTEEATIAEGEDRTFPNTLKLEGTVETNGGRAEGKGAAREQGQERSRGNRADDRIVGGT